MALVYLLTNTQNGKRYVGKTVRSLEIRWWGHVGSARREDTDMLVCRAIHKHGPEAFTRQVIEECDDSVLGARETHWIRELKTHVSEGGYNLTYGGDGGIPGFKFKDESREKIRQKALGRKPSSETRAKMRAAKLGKKQAPEHVEKRAAANRKPRREGTGKKIGDARRGAPHSQPIEQLTASGEVIALHKSMTAVVKLTGMSRSELHRVVKSSVLKDGCYWRFKQGEN